MSDRQTASLRDDARVAKRNLTAIYKGILVTVIWTQKIDTKKFTNCSYWAMLFKNVTHSQPSTKRRLHGVYACQTESVYAYYWG